MEGGVPRGLFMKLQLAQKNRNGADAVRQQRKELDELKAKRLEEQAERIERLKQKRATKHAEARQEHLAHVQSIGAAVRREVREAEQVGREDIGERPARVAVCARVK